ncbi:hypothetical protein J4426_02365 [Candidatus Woesearchaeota archaeon]|nr:hypothetical protein [Candidatus Woesearchaeota archaeon]
MPENDIYNNKEKYEGFLRNLDLILVPSEKRTDKNANKSVYFCKHKDNIKHFRKLAEKFDTRDLSYVRRCRILNTLRLISYATKKDFSKCDRDNIDRIVAFVSQPITISDDTGADFFCTLFDIKKIKKQDFLFPRKAFAIQIKSSKEKKWDITDKESYIRHLEIPFFWGIVDKKGANTSNLFSLPFNFHLLATSSISSYFSLFK